MKLVTENDEEVHSMESEAPMAVAGFVGGPVVGGHRCQSRRVQAVFSGGRARRTWNRRVRMSSEEAASNPIKRPVDQSSSETSEEIAAQQEAGPKGLIGHLSRVFIALGKVLGFVDSEQKRSLIQRLSNYGVAAVISYGLFDLVTYSISFLLAVKSYTATSGAPLAMENLPAVLAIMYGINNVSRPLRIAGAAFIAPTIDKFVVKPVQAWLALFRGEKGGKEENGE